MALHNVFKVRNQFFFYKGSISKHVLRALWAVGISAVVAVSFLGYRWYRVHRAQAAQKHFSDCVKEYTGALQSGTQSWGVIARIFELGSQEYARTSMAPFYLAYQAQALLKDNKLAEAAQVMEKAVHGMPSDHELYPLYALKSALMNIDAQELAGEVTQEAVQKLTDLASNQNNKQRDAALYYLGRYYLSKGDGARARETLQELMDMHHGQDGTRSPWIKEAGVIMQQIVA